MINPTTWINPWVGHVLQKNRAHYVYELFSHYYWFTYNLNFSNLLPLRPIHKLFLTDSLEIKKAGEKPHLFQGQTGPTLKITTQDSWGWVWNKQIAFGTSLLLIGATFFHKLSRWCIWKSYFEVIHFIHVHKAINVICQNAVIALSSIFAATKRQLSFPQEKPSKPGNWTLISFSVMFVVAAFILQLALAENNFCCLFNENLVMQEVW